MVGVTSPLHSLTPKVLNVERKTQRWRVPRTHLCLEWNMFAEESCCVESAGIGRDSQRIERDPARGPTDFFSCQKLIFKIRPSVPTSQPARGFENATPQYPVTPVSGYQVRPSFGVHAAPPSFAVMTTVWS